MKKSEFRHFRALVIVVFVASIFSFFSGGKNTTSADGWVPSTFNAHPDGYEALFETLGHCGWPVGRWQTSYQSLDEEHGVMIIARGTQARREAFTVSQIDQLLAWVRRGNRLVLLGDFSAWPDTRPFLTQLGFTLGPEPMAGNTLFEQGATFFNTGHETITLRPSAGSPFPPEETVVLDRCNPLPPGPKTERVLWQHGDQPCAGEIPAGAGSVVLISSPSLFSNRLIAANDNLPFALWALQPGGIVPGRVWFEETHQGYRSTYTLGELLAQPSLQLALTEIGLALMALFSSQFIRFGQVVPLVRHQSRATMEFARSMAQLYRRANLRNDTVEFLYRETRQQILRKLNLPAQTPPEVVAKMMAEAFPHLPPWKKLAHRFDSNDYKQGLPPSGWLKTAQDLIRIRNATV